MGFQKSHNSFWFILVTKLVGKEKSIKSNWISKNFIYLQERNKLLMRVSPQAIYIVTVSANKLQAFRVMLDMLYFNA